VRKTVSYAGENRDPLHLLTVAETCDLQRLNVLAYLSAAIARHRSHQQIASLLPNK
jgi:hypothetical protein